MAAGGRLALFDTHCHLQDSRILLKAQELLRLASERGVEWIVVNGTSEADWATVKALGEDHASVIPCYGLHPWFVNERSQHWLSNLKAMLERDPTAAVGEVGLCQSPRGKTVEAELQLHVLRQQLHLARELQRPVTVHCVGAFEPLTQLLKEMGRFPSGFIMHSFVGNQEQVKELAKYGVYFSFSGHKMSLKREKAQRIWRAVPSDRLLLETDCPDALPRVDPKWLVWVPGDSNAPSERAELPGKDALNQPANVRALLAHGASLLEISEEDLAERTFRNSKSLFSYPGSKLSKQSVKIA